MSKRLQKILSAIPRCHTLADVGCDHGYIGIGALQSEVCSQVLFVDISAPSLQKAANALPVHLKERAEFFVRDGIGDLQCDCAVIAGMGGLEIMSILTNTVTLPKWLVLQPMRNQVDLRQYLLNNYNIVSDTKFADGKFYDLIVAQLSESKQALSPLELTFGLTNIACPSQDFVQFLLVEQAKAQNILQHCPTAPVKDYLEQVNAVLARTEEI